MKPSNNFTQKNPMENPTQEAKTNDELPTPEDLFLKTPLYRSYDVTRPQAVHIMEVELFDGAIRVHCCDCGHESIFRTDRVRENQLKALDGYVKPRWVEISNRPKEGYSPLRSLSEFKTTPGEGRFDYALGNRTFDVEFYCTANHTHRIYFHFVVYNGRLTKVGQYPSFGDLHTKEIGKYRKVLGKEKYGEFSRAVNLFSHDIGIGSFVYLRRIFEHLIEEAHHDAEESESWNDETFETKRMDEKILSLKDFLPSFLVRNRGIYSILSKGIHKLTEQECLDYFHKVKAGMELILDEKIAGQIRAQKEKELQEQLGAIHGQLRTSE